MTDGITTGPQAGDVLYAASKLKQEKPDNIKAAWETGSLSAELKKQFDGDYDSYKSYYEKHDEHYKETGEIMGFAEKLCDPSKKEDLNAAWETGPLSARLKKEFGWDSDSYKAYYENEEHYKATGKIVL